MNKQANLSVSSVRIILFGSEGGFSRPVLEQLLVHGLCVAAVVMVDAAHDNSHFPITVKKPPKPGGLVETAMKNRIEVLKTRNLGAPLFIEQLTEISADLILVACFAQKIPALIWKHMEVPCWNLHPSLLPKYRGLSPLYWQIKSGETETGLTLHEVTGRMDAGDIVARKSVPLPESTENTVLDNWVAEHGVEIFNNALIRYLQGGTNPEPQDESQASYCPAGR